MATQDIKINLQGTEVVYSSTSTDNTITLTDDAFGIFHAITELSKAINRLAGLIK